ncbi:hypothetical protein ACOME3_003284 [Neoechinorhynchus agilis]
MPIRYTSRRRLLLIPCAFIMTSMILLIVWISNSKGRIHRPLLDDCSVGYLSIESVKFVRMQYHKCRALLYFSKIFNVEVVDDIHLNIPNGMRASINNDRLLSAIENDQVIIKIKNKFTKKESVYCPLRSKRPVPNIFGAETEHSFMLATLKNSVLKCDFCSGRYGNFTAIDRDFDRIETAYSYTAANAFKYEKHHDLIVARRHNPFDLNVNEFIDLLLLSVRWTEKRSRRSKESLYPSVVWDIMPKSGASQIHTHLHVSLSKRPASVPAEVLEAISRYWHQTGSNDFIGDYVAVHKAMQLAVRLLNDIYFVINLDSQKDYEFILFDLGKNVHHPTINFSKVLHASVFGMIEEYKLFAFSMGCNWKPMVLRFHF